jgi:hypothetical protein
MPYLEQSKKEALDTGLVLASDPGELNYILTKTILGYWNRSARNYRALNDIMGALEGCKLEAYRRLISVYEDAKIKANGDVY